MNVTTGNSNIKEEAISLNNAPYGRIFVIVGLNGDGSHTIAEIIASTFGIKRIIPYTTRSRRTSEVDAQDYYFIDHKSFVLAANNGEFLEFTSVKGDLYGVMHRDIKRARMEGHICLVLSRHGAMKLKRYYGNQVTSLFICAKYDVLEKKLSDLGMKQKELENQLLKHKCDFVFEYEDLAYMLFDLSRKIELLLQRNLIELD